MTFEEFSRNYKVQAERIEEDNTSVITQQGSVTAQSGQWEVRHPDGQVQVMDDDEFQETYGDRSDDSSDVEDGDEEENTAAAQSGFLTPNDPDVDEDDDTV